MCRTYFYSFFLSRRRTTLFSPRRLQCRISLLHLMHTHVIKHKYTHTHSLSIPPKQTHFPRYFTHAHTKHTHIHTRYFSLTITLLSQTHSLDFSLSSTHALSLFQTHAHTISLSNTHTHYLSFKHTTHINSLSLSLTHSFTDKLTSNTHTHRHTHAHSHTWLCGIYVWMDDPTLHSLMLFNVSMSTNYLSTGSFYFLK